MHLGAVVLPFLRVIARASPHCPVRVLIGTGRQSRQVDAVSEPLPLFMTEHVARVWARPFLRLRLRCVPAKAALMQTSLCKPDARAVPQHRSLTRFFRVLLNT